MVIWHPFVVVVIVLLTNTKFFALAARVPPVTGDPPAEASPFTKYDFNAKSLQSKAHDNAKKFHIKLLPNFSNMFLSTCISVFN